MLKSSLRWSNIPQCSRANDRSCGVRKVGTSKSYTVSTSSAGSALGFSFSASFVEVSFGSVSIASPPSLFGSVVVVAASVGFSSPSPLGFSSVVAAAGFSPSALTTTSSLGVSS